MNELSVSALFLTSALFLQPLPPPADSPSPSELGDYAGRCGLAPAAPSTAPEATRVPLFPTERAPHAIGHVEIALVSSPFDLPVTRDGSYIYDVRFSIEALPVPPSKVAVAWVTTPELDEVEKIGEVDAEGNAVGTAKWNKFMLFVTAEDSPEVERWSGPVLLRGISPSGKMQSFMGHSVFGPEPC